MEILLQWIALGINIISIYLIMKGLNILIDFVIEAIFSFLEKSPEERAKIIIAIIVPIIVFGGHYLLFFNSPDIMTNSIEQSLDMTKELLEQVH